MIRTITKHLFATSPATVAPLVLRVVVGAIFFAHGAQKVFGAFGGFGLEGTGGWFESTLGLAPGVFWAGLVGGTELVGGIALALGLLTRPFAAALAVTMTVALVTVHGGSFFLPDGAEFVLALLAGSVSLAASGAGRWSLDAAVDRSLNQTETRAPAPASASQPASA